MIIGIVGKPNCGKSTFFKAATLAEVEIGNRPFVTIKPNHGTGYVKTRCVEKEFNIKCEPKEGYCVEGNRFVAVDLYDVAGLVPGAHEGKGLGNQFLDDLRQADILVHVIDVSGSTNEKGEEVEIGSYNPGNDVRFLEHEIDMWFFQIIKKGWERFARQVQQEQTEIDKALAKQLSGLKIKEEDVEEAMKTIKLPESVMKWKDDDLKKLATELRKLTKPMIIAANKADMKTGKENYEKLKKEFKDYMIKACSAESELALREAAKKEMIRYVPGERDFEVVKEKRLSEEQKKGLGMIRELVLERFGSTGVQEILDRAVFDLLGYITVYPVGSNLADSEGRKLPDCFLVRKDTTALELAYKLHSDFGDNFIRAIDVRTKRVVGKEHKLKNGDVIEIVTKK